MYILSAISAGERFSEAVKRAVEKRLARTGRAGGPVGNGRGEKGLILARLLGYRGPVPTPDDPCPALEQVSQGSLFRGLPAFDKEGGPGRARAQEGRAAIRRHGDAAGRFAKLAAVPASSPMGSLSRAQPDRLLRPGAHAASRSSCRADRGTGGHGGGDSERYLFVGG